MENLATIINNRYTDYKKLSEEVEECLHALLRELGSSPTNIHTECGELSQPPLAWRITIIDKSVTLTYEQFALNYKLIKSKNPGFTIKESLTNFILSNFTW